MQPKTLQILKILRGLRGYTPEPTCGSTPLAWPSLRRQSESQRSYRSYFMNDHWYAAVRPIAQGFRHRVTDSKVGLTMA